MSGILADLGHKAKQCAPFMIFVEFKAIIRNPEGELVPPGN